ncbi:MAG: TIGR02391 family protein [Ilumatobacteraceae bacterium]
MYSWPWDTCFDACIELEGTLSSLEELAEILGPRGPQLAAASLHPWVWNSALDLWSVGKYRPAVLDSYTKVEAMTQAKLSLIDLSGRKLWGEAFSMSQPRQGRARLRFGELPERSERRSAAQEGAMHFAIGCAQGIRNWAAHTNESATEHVALEYLASLSVLARWVDECVVELAPSP